MQFISNIRFWLFIFDKTEWQSNCRKRNCPSNATRHLLLSMKSELWTKVIHYASRIHWLKKPIAFAFNLRFYLATLFRKGLISCLPVRTAQAQPKLFARLRVARWNGMSWSKESWPTDLLPGKSPRAYPGGGGTPIHCLYGYVPPNGVVILKLLI